MPCSNCVKLYTTTGIKTPHWYFGNRNTCPFPGGPHNKGTNLVAVIRDEQGNMIRNEEGTNWMYLTRNEISEMWGDMCDSDKYYYLNALIRNWCAKISPHVSFVLEKQEI